MKDKSVQSIAFSPNGKTVAAGYLGYSSAYGGDRGAVLWDVAARKRVIEEPLHLKDGSPAILAFSPDGTTLAAGTRYSDHGNGVALWDMTRHECLVDGPLPVKDADVESLAFSPDSKSIAVGYRVGVLGNVGGVLLSRCGSARTLG